MTDPDYGMAMRRIADEAVIIRIANALDGAVDGKDWAKARSFFAENIKVDLGDGVKPMAADELIGMWSGNLGPKKTSLHLRGNHVVEVHGDHAVILSNAYAWNRMEGNGDPLWEVWGHYRYELERASAHWRITLFSFHPTHERGNQWVKTTPSA
jgi:hypothetical protein